MRTFAAATTALALVSASSAFAADLPLKAPPPAAPVLNWTGFYIGGVAGGARSDDKVNYSANDPLSAFEIAGPAGGNLLVTSYNLNRSGPVGGLEIGYNWQAGSYFVLGVEADISAAAVSGSATATSIRIALPGLPTQFESTTSEQDTKWYGTVRGRLGWVATPNLLLFGTAGLAYGRTSVTGNFAFSGPTAMVTGNFGGFSLVCAFNAPCFTGASAADRTGWVAGAGAEYRFDAHWSVKLEYQFVDLGTQLLTVSAITFLPGTAPASFTAAFRDQMHVVRAGLNYHF
jgi:outer membrane immunogenic protein